MINRIKYHSPMMMLVYFAALSFYLYYGIYKMVFVNREYLGGDFLIYLNAMSHFFSNTSIYAHPSGAPPFLYPPLSLVVFLPFHFIDDARIAIILWYIISTVIVFLSAAILIIILRGSNTRIALESVILSFCFSMPLYHGISVGNANILILFGFCIIYWALFRNKYLIIPFILSILTFLKVFPVFFLVVLLRHKMWREIFIYILLMIAGTITSVFIFGAEEHIHFLMNLSSAIPFIGPPNISLSLILKLFLPHISHQSIVLLNLFFSLSVLGIWYFTTQNVPNKGHIADLIVIQSILFLIIPYSWYQYYMFLIIPFSILLFINLQNNAGFKYFRIFSMVFFLINFWEFIIYQIPLTSEKLTAFMIFNNRDQHPVLYDIMSIIPVCLNIFVTYWLLVNYRSLANSTATLKSRINRKPQQGTC